MPKTREIAKDTVGARLRAARQRQHLTLAQVGRSCGVSAQAVAQWEYGNAEPSIAALSALAQLFEIRIDEITGDRSLDEITDKLEEIIEFMPLARRVIIDTERRTIAPHDGLYVVSLKAGERAPIVGRVVLPKKI